MIFFIDCVDGKTHSYHCEVSNVSSECSFLDFKQIYQSMHKLYENRLHQMKCQYYENSKRLCKTYQKAIVLGL